MKIQKPPFALFLQSLAVLALGSTIANAQIVYIDPAKTTTAPEGKFVVNLSGTVTTATNLLDYNTGDSFGSVIMTGGTYSSSSSVDSEWGGAAGTPAFDHFEGFIDNSDGAGFTSTSRVFTFSSLDITKSYVLTVTGIRNTNVTTSQSANYTIGGVDAFTNTSTSTVGFGTVVSGASTELTSGTQDIAQWSGINVGADGIFSLTWSQGANASGNTYISAISLQAVPEPATSLLLGLGLTVMLFNRRLRGTRA